MGMFDEIFVEEAVINRLDIHCSECGRVPVSGERYQTKDFDNCMNHYYLAYADDGEIHLFKLDEPEDKRFWHEYTDEEIKEWNDDFVTGSRWAFMKREKGDGHWKEEAWHPQNRRQRYMGELPHQWVRMYTICKCCDKGKGFVEYKIKFTDGIVTAVERIQNES